MCRGLLPAQSILSYLAPFPGPCLVCLAPHSEYLPARRTPLAVNRQDAVLASPRRACSSLLFHRMIRIIVWFRASANTSYPVCIIVSSVPHIVATLCVVPYEVL